MDNATSAHEFIKKHVQPDSWQQTKDRRGELALRLVRRSPEIVRASGPNEREAVFRALLQVACEVGGERQREALATLAEATRDVPDMARQLRAEVSKRAMLSRNQGTIDDSGCLGIHARLARTIASTVSFDVRLHGYDSGPQTNDFLAELSSLDALMINDDSDAQELASLLGDMLNIVREMPVDQKREWLTALAQAAGCLRRYGNELVEVFDAILEVTRGLRSEDQGGPLAPLAETARYLPRWANKPRAALLACAQVAWRGHAIDDNQYAEILVILSLATATADLNDDLGPFDLLGDAIKDKALPPEYKGRLFGSLCSPDVVSRQAGFLAEACFEKAWEGLKQLEPEHAEKGIKILSLTGTQIPHTSLAEMILRSMLAKIEESPDSAWHPLLLRAMAPIIAVPSRGANSSLDRELSMIDARSPVRARDFVLHRGYWKTAHAVQIFDHMYPLVEGRSNEEEQAGELEALTKIVTGRPGDGHVTLYAQLNKILDGLERITELSLRPATLRRARGALHKLPSAHFWETHRRLDDLSANHPTR